MKSIKHILILLLVFITGTTLLACGKNSNEEKEHYCTYSDWVTVKEADCINDGLEERSCYECGRKMSEVIEAYGHLFSASAGSFAEDGDGFVYQKACVNNSCSARENVTTEIIIEVVDPTCEKTGTEKKIYRAAVDGTNYEHVVTTTIPAVDHDYSYASGTWTWNGYGEATYTVKCNMNRSHTYTYDAQISTETVAPTCTENGAKIHTATVIVDGESYTTSVNQTLPKTNHSYDY
jgi:hypothetical protein